MAVFAQSCRELLARLTILVNLLRCQGYLYSFEDTVEGFPNRLVVYWWWVCTVMYVPAVQRQEYLDNLATQERSDIGR